MSCPELISFMLEILQMIQSLGNLFKAGGNHMAILLIAILAVEDTAKILQKWAKRWSLGGVEVD